MVRLFLKNQVPATSHQINRPSKPFLPQDLLKEIINVVDLKPVNKTEQKKNTK